MNPQSDSTTAVETGLVCLSSSLLLFLKNRRSRRGERGLVIPNERVATTSDDDE